MSGVPWYVEHAGWLSLPLALALVFAGRWLTVWFGARRSRDQAAERRAELGDALSSLSARYEDEVVTLEGRLEVRDEPATAHHLGGPCAVSTFEASAARTWHEPTGIETHGDRRAASVVLVSPAGVIPLQGALTVRAGTREHWPGVSMKLLAPAVAERVEEDLGYDPRTFDDFPVFRTVDDGDEVVVRGRVRRAKREGGARTSYREQAVTWAIEPAGIAIAVAAARAPKTTTRNSLLVAGPSIVLAVALVGYASLMLEVDADDAAAQCSWSCLTDGACDAVLEVGWRTRVHCAPTIPRPCARMRVCTEQGRCTADGGRCIATDDAECRATEACEHEGRCSARGGLCVVATRDDCRPTKACESSGRCSPLGKGAASFCGYGTDADCAGAIDCRLKGRCVVESGYCVASLEGCRRSVRCQQEGLCTADPISGACIAASDEDCHGSNACTRTKRCFYGRGACLRYEQAAELRRGGEREPLPAQMR